jgi:hypothetical protein
MKVAVYKRNGNATIASSFGKTIDVWALVACLLRRGLTDPAEWLSTAPDFF